MSYCHIFVYSLLFLFTLSHFQTLMLKYIYINTKEFLCQKRFN